MSECKDCRYFDKSKFYTGLWYCQNPNITVASLPIDTEKCFEPRCCSTCDFYEDEICVNGNSAFRADYRHHYNNCEHWEQKGE